MLVDIAVSRLRAELAECLRRVAGGEELVVTDRGTPVARLVPVGSAALLDQLIEDGVLTRARRASRPSARTMRRARADGPVADLVGEQRR